MNDDERKKLIDLIVRLHALGEDSRDWWGDKAHLKAMEDAERLIREEKG